MTATGARKTGATGMAGMVMGMAQRPLGAGILGLRAMLSPDPFMGAKGYPLLLAAEPASGRSAAPPVVVLFIFLTMVDPVESVLESVRAASKTASPNEI